MKNDISQIDKNLQISKVFDEKDMKLYDVRDKPFKVCGLYNYKAEKVFKRMPDDVAQATSEGVANLNYNTAGGRVRFATSSRYVAIMAKMPSVCRLSHMPLTGTSGFDLYVNQNGTDIFYKNFSPPIDMQYGFESIAYFPDSAMREITINFPPYNNLDNLYIGLQDGADLKTRSEYKYRTPVLFYGSSITQGACASRPGNAYEAIISRRVDCDYINMGFSGQAKGEDAIAEYMSNLDISVFVCDYDHNAPDVTHLSNTHSRLYKKMRNKQKDLPIILISRPDFDSNPDESVLRRDVIYSTYMEAIKNGDRNLYYIDGQSLFKDDGRDGCTVDGCHPNDLGFMRMAEVIGAVIQKIIK
jgi:hypothetical protein